MSKPVTVTDGSRNPRIPIISRRTRHLAFKVENIDEYVAYLLENSIDCEPIRVDELTGMKYTFFRDPDYLPIELYENNY